MSPVEMINAPASPSKTSSRFKIPYALLEESQSLITSSISLPHKTHTHTSWLRNSPCHRGSIVRNGLCQSKECAFAFGEGCLPQPCSQDGAAWVWLWLSRVQASLLQCFPYVHLPWTLSNTWVMLFSQLITYIWCVGISLYFKFHLFLL